MSFPKHIEYILFKKILSLSKYFIHLQVWKFAFFYPEMFEAIGRRGEGGRIGKGEYSCYCHHLPALGRKSRLFFSMKVDWVGPLNLESQNQSENISGLLSSQTKIWGKSIKGFMSYDRTLKQTSTRTNLFVCWYVRWGRESRVPQIVITATQICFAASALLNW